MRLTRKADKLLKVVFGALFIPLAMVNDFQSFPLMIAWVSMVGSLGYLLVKYGR